MIEVDIQITQRHDQPPTGYAVLVRHLLSNRAVSVELFDGLEAQQATALIGAMENFLAKAQYNGGFSYMRTADLEPYFTQVPDLFVKFFSAPIELLDYECDYYDGDGVGHHVAVTKRRPNEEV